MNLINVENKEGQLVVGSREVAINFEKRHDSVLRDIENLMSNVGSPQNCGNLFIESKYQNDQNKQWYKEYLLTRDGFTLLVMGFTGKEALQWKLKYIDAFNKMETALKDPYKNLSPELRAIFSIDEKQQEIDKRVTVLENTMTIDYTQQYKLSIIANEAVIRALGGKDTPAYRELGKKAFSSIWRDYKRIMQVNTYKNTSVKEFDKGKKVLESWKPSRELELMIVGANSQMIIDEVAATK